MTTATRRRGSLREVQTASSAQQPVTSEQFYNTMELYQERIAELEFALEDQGWVQLAADGAADFSRSGLRLICKQARLNYLKNPLIKRAISLQAAYVFGQGVKVQAKAKKVEKALRAFWDEPSNQAELFSHEALLDRETDLAVYGNLFFALFTLGNGDVRVRTLNVDEVEDIVTNPQDRREIWYYKRVWVEKGDDGRPVTKHALYPDWRYLPRTRPSSYDKMPINWDAPIYHVKVGGLGDMKFGVPEMYSALDWAKAYKTFLEDWAVLVKALSKYAWKMTLKGAGKSQLKAARDKIGTTVTAASPAERNPTGTASVYVGTDSADLAPMPKSGATISADDGRRLLLMVCAGTGWPETFFGDVSVGTLATAKSLDRPTELRLKNRQMLWASILKNVSLFAMNAKARSASQLVSFAADTSVVCSFPPIVQHDAAEVVGAIIDAASMGGKQLDDQLMPPELLRRLLLTALSTVANITEEDFNWEPPEPEPGDEPPPTDPNAPPGANDPNAPPANPTPNTAPNAPGNAPASSTQGKSPPPRTQAQASPQRATARAQRRRVSAPALLQAAASLPDVPESVVFTLADRAHLQTAWDRAMPKYKGLLAAVLSD